MDTEITRDAAIEQILQASIDDPATSSDATIDAASLVDRFAGTVYFAEKVADTRPASGAAPIRSKRGHRAPARPWRVPATNRNPKS